MPALAHRLPSPQPSAPNCALTDAGGRPVRGPTAGVRQGSSTPNTTLKRVVKFASV
ncbi:MAG: hypothetical protein U0791_15245 [Gemmataceae bacterium]